MRMWLVDPEKMCNQHLLGEHVEMHMFVGSIRKGISLRGYVDGGLVDVTLIKKRHESLAREMQRRGMAHKSPMLGSMRELLVHFIEPRGRVDPAASYAELLRRCPACRARQPG